MIPKKEVICVQSIRKFVELQEEYFKKYGVYWNEMSCLYISVYRIYNAYPNLRDEPIAKIGEIVQIVDEYEEQFKEARHEEYKQYVLDQIKEE